MTIIPQIDSAGQFLAASGNRASLFFLDSDSPLSLPVSTSIERLDPATIIQPKRIDSHAIALRYIACANVWSFLWKSGQTRLHVSGREGEAKEAV